MRSLLEEYRARTEGLTLKDLKPGLSIVNKHTMKRFTITGRDSDGDWEMKQGRQTGLILDPEDFKLFTIAGPAKGEDTGIPGITMRVRVTNSMFAVAAYKGSKKVGQVTAVLYPSHASVDKAKVLKEFQRQGVATAIYRKAAEFACKRGVTLRSSSNARSVMASAFWQNETRLGHVKQVGSRSDGGYWEYKCPVQF